jgi:hypothetical protein
MGALRNEIREKLVMELREKYPESLPVLPVQRQQPGA